MNCLVCDRVDAGYRYACPGCIDTARRRLRDIETYAAMLPAMLQPGRNGHSRRAPGYTSQPPVRLEASVALDPRSRSLALERDGDVWDPETDDEDPTPSIVGTLHSIARWIREEQELDEPTKTPTITRETGYLLGAVDWCAQRQWVDELAEQIRKLHSTVRRLAHDKPPGPLAECMRVDCNGVVHWTRDVPDPNNPGHTQDAAVCSADDHHLYVGLDLIRLKVGRQEAG